MTSESRPTGPQTSPAPANGGLRSRQPSLHRSVARRSGPQGAQASQDVESVVLDLHDLAINRLSQLAFELSAVSNLLDSDPLKRMIRVIDSVEDLVGEVRWFVLAGLDRSKGTGDLAPSIRQLADEGAERMGGTAEVRIDGDLPRLPSWVRHHLRAVVAEAVQNAAAHSSGSRLAVSLAVAPGEVVARVVDDGCGPPDPPRHGIGLGSMASRARQLGGDFTFREAAGGGAEIIWRVPLRLTT